MHLRRLLDGRPAVTEAKFNETFPEVAKVATAAASSTIRDPDDPDLRRPRRPRALAIEAMEAGKDVMVDKPGCTTLEQLEACASARSGRAASGRSTSRNASRCPP